MSNEYLETFKAECEEEISRQGMDSELKNIAKDFYNKSAEYKYSYHFSWMGRPVIQLPQDMFAMQEIIWNFKPDFIVETGIAHGGSLVFYASILDLIGHGEVIGVDIDIRQHNKIAIEEHPMNHRIHMIQGSSIDPAIVEEISKRVTGRKVLVVLDSNHTHEHVLNELRLYAPLVSIDSYCVVMDTVVEDMPENAFPDRPWGRGDNPKTAVMAYLKENNNFIIDEGVDNKLLISVAPSGYLKRVL